MDTRHPLRLPTFRLSGVAALGASLVVACGGDPDPQPETGSVAPLGEADIVVSITGLTGPEAVRYDADQDLYFVSNWPGDPGSPDSIGFISRVSPEGEILDLRFMGSHEGAPLHAPRGMTIVGDTLWAADLNGLHAFSRLDGSGLGFIDLTEFEPGFLNDVIAAPGGGLYVTDTGRGRVYHAHADGSRVAVETQGEPNGITWDAERGVFLVVMWSGSSALWGWDPETGATTALGDLGVVNNDGVEVVNGSVYVASQEDSAIHRWTEDGDRIEIQLPGGPADIGIDTRRNRIAVPYVALNRVDVWALRP